MAKFPDWLESIPFPMIITNREAVIKSYNSLFSNSLIMSQLGRIYKSYFENGKYWGAIMYQ